MLRVANSGVLESLNCKNSSTALAMPVGELGITSLLPVAALAIFLNIPGFGCGSGSEVSKPILGCGAFIIPGGALRPAVLIMAQSSRTIAVKRRARSAF